MQKRRKAKIHNQGILERNYKKEVFDEIDNKGRTPAFIILKLSYEFCKIML